MHSGEFNRQVEEVLRGSYDLHVHAGPDPNAERRLDALDTARWAHEAEMAGFVLKSHEYPTAPLAYVMNRIYPGLNVAGAIVLNPEVGGLNPHAVQVAADLGTRVVWMPTHHAHFYLANLGRGPGIEILGDAGTLKPEVQDILDIVADRDMVLASAHVSPAESMALFKEARGKGIGRMVITHPDGVVSMEQQQEMVSLGAYAEYTFLPCMPSRNASTPERMVAALRMLGVERCVVSTDFGETTSPPAAEGMRMTIASLLQAGLKPEEVTTLVKSNPLQLVGSGP